MAKSKSPAESSKLGWLGLALVVGLIAAWFSWRSMAPEPLPDIAPGENARTTDEPERFAPGVVPAHPGH